MTKKIHAKIAPWSKFRPSFTSRPGKRIKNKECCFVCNIVAPSTRGGKLADYIVNGWIEHRAGSAVAWYKGSIGLLDDKESATPLVKEVWWCHFISFLCCWLFAPNVSHLEESTLIIPTKYVRCLFFLRLKIVQGLKQTHDDTFDVNVIRTIS